MPDRLNRLYRKDIYVLANQPIVYRWCSYNARGIVFLQVFPKYYHLSTLSLIILHHHQHGAFGKTSFSIVNLKHPTSPNHPTQNYPTSPHFRTACTRSDWGEATRLGPYRAESKAWTVQFWLSSSSISGPALSRSLPLSLWY